MATRPRILLSGPVPPPTGGIAGVVHMIETGPLATRFDFQRFDMTERRVSLASPIVRWSGALLARSFGFDGFVHWETPARLRAFSRRLDAVRPDLVHLHSSHALDFLQSACMARSARRRGIPSLLQLHGNFDVFHPRWSRLRRRVFAAALRVPDRVVVLSESWRRWFAQHVDPARIVVLPNAVDVQRFRPREAAAANDPPRILFVGLREPGLKGARELFDAVRALAARGVPLRLVCCGDDVEGLAARVAADPALAPHVEWRGQRAPDAMPAEYAACDLLALPSHWEGLPLAVLEAMASGLPVVASAVGAIPDVLVDGRNGLLVPPRNAAALAGALERLLRDPGLRRRMGEENREVAEREHSVARHAERLGSLYDVLLAGR